MKNYAKIPKKENLNRIKIIGLILCMLFFISGCSNIQTKSALGLKDPTSVILWHYYMGDKKIALVTTVESFNKSVGSRQGVVVSAVSKGSIVEREKALTESAKGVINAQLKGSYDLRLILEEALMEIGLAGRKSGLALKEMGLTEAVLLVALDLKDISYVDE